MLEEFEGTLTKDYLKADLQKYGLKAPIIENYFAEFVETITAKQDA